MAEIVLFTAIVTIIGGCSIKNEIVRIKRLRRNNKLKKLVFKKKLNYKEIPVHIKYTDYSKSKGQHWTKSFSLGMKMIIRKLIKR